MSTSLRVLRWTTDTRKVAERSCACVELKGRGQSWVGMVGYRLAGLVWLFSKRSSSAFCPTLVAVQSSPALPRSSCVASAGLSCRRAEWVMLALEWTRWTNVKVLQLYLLPCAGDFCASPSFAIQLQSWWPLGCSSLKYAPAVSPMQRPLLYPSPRHAESTPSSPARSSRARSVF